MHTSPLLIVLVLFVGSWVQATTRPETLAHAMFIAAQNLRAKTISTLKCPNAQQVGGRPSSHTEEHVGNLCEPWMVRGAVMVLDHYLDPTMRGLEWSAGSSSLWALRRLQHLYSVEHVLPWASHLQKLALNQYSQLSNKWTLVGVPCKDVTAGACARSKQYSGGPGTDYTEYVLAPAKRFRPSFPFDYVLVDGRARSKCIDQVLREEMLNQNYGVLVLDNSDRNYNTSAIPRHWLCISLRSSVDETTMWMRCDKHDSVCTKARRSIVKISQEILPPHLVGTRCRHSAT